MEKTYAVITGAAEGLGKAFAVACARMGYNLLLIDLPGTKLESLARQIRNAYSAKVCVLEQDLCESSAVDAITKMVMEKILRVSMLINNAGLGLSMPFDEMNNNLVSKMIRLNVEIPTSLSMAMLPYLKQEKNATIINISSVASYFNLPTKSVYVASKAYLRYFSQSLRIELAKSGVHVCVVCPGGMRSNQKQYIILKTSPWLIRHTAMYPERVANAALQAAMHKKPMLIPGLLNRVIFYGTSWFPNWLKEMMAANTMKAVSANRPQQPLLRYL